MRALTDSIAFVEQMTLRISNPHGQLLQQPTLTAELQTVGACPVDQHRDQLLIRHLRHTRRTRLLSHCSALGCRVTHLASLP
jgi:hypothetical protein